VSGDGRFLVLLRASQEAPPPLTLVFNWTQLVRKQYLAIGVSSRIEPAEKSSTS
jgi:hypothetical protein